MSEHDQLGDRMNPAPEPADDLVQSMIKRADYWDTWIADGEGCEVGYSHAGLVSAQKLDRAVVARIVALTEQVRQLNEGLDMVAEERDVFQKSSLYWVASASDEKHRAERAEAECAKLREEVKAAKDAIDMTRIWKAEEAFDAALDEYENPK